MCKQPEQICLGASQFFCVDQRCALPCDPNEVPCTVTVAGFTCFYKWTFLPACCALNQELERDLEAKKASN